MFRVVNWRPLIVVAVIAAVFGAAFGYLGANFEMGWITGLAQTAGGSGATSAHARPSDPYEKYGPYTQYLQHLGLGATGGGPAGAYQRGLFELFYDLYRLEGFFSPVTGRDPGSFGQYLINQPSGSKDIDERAEEILTSLFDAGVEGRTAAKRRFGVLGYDPAGNPVREVSEQNERDLLSLALRRQFGRLGTAHLVNRLDTERNIYSQRQAQGTATAPSFLDFLRNKYGIR